MNLPKYRAAKKQKNSANYQLIPWIILLSIAGLVLSFVFYLSALGVTSRDSKTFILEKGISLRNLSSKLADAGLLQIPSLFFWEVRLFENYEKFQAGNYRFESGYIKPSDIINKFQNGEVYNELVLEVTIPEGYTQKQVTERLANAINVSTEKFLVKENLLALYGVPFQGSLEGFLYPATYRFFNTLPDANGLFAAMVGEFFKRLPKDYEIKLKGINLSLYQAITFASLIEKEAFFDDEKKQISEVIWRRLKNNEPLGIDASIIYGIADYKGDLTTFHLKDSSNPYNLRLKRGLPPTPICSPTVDSLKAVLEPTNKGYYYYVLLPGVEKRHHFSTNLREHNANVQKLVQYQKRAKN